MKKQKLLGAIAMNNLEIKKFRTNSAFPVYILTIMMNSSHLMYFQSKVGATEFMKMYSMSGNSNEESLTGNMSRYNYGQVYVKK